MTERPSLSLLFWVKHPALLYGISLLLGIYASLTYEPALLIPCLLLWSPFVLTNQIKFLILSLLVFFTAWITTSAFYYCAPLPEKGVEGLAEIEIVHLRLKKSAFGTKWIYFCRLHHFYPAAFPHHSIAKGIQCEMHFPGKVKRPEADQIYFIQGRLLEKGGKYRLRISSFKPWQLGGTASNMVERRYKWKSGANEWVQKKFIHPLNGLLLAGLMTGEVDSPQLRQEFSRFGLQHLLAISGFHFAILASFLNVILRFIFTRQVAWMLLITGLTLYCIFLGFSPSVMRAWIMSCLMLLGSLLEKETSSLNTLGVSLIAVLIYDPLIVQSPGFQFSFLITAALLLACQPFDHLLQFILPKRSLAEITQMSLIDQHGVYILNLLRKGLALAAAVNWFAFPLTLFLFQQFPWTSLAYNLFFPFLISLSMGLLMLGGVFAFIPFIAKLIHALNDTYTHRVLQLVHQMPENLDSIFIFDRLPASYLIIYVSLSIWLLIIYHSFNSRINKGEEWRWSFL